MKIIFFHKSIINLSKIISFLGIIFIIGTVYLLNKNYTVSANTSKHDKDISSNEFEVSVLNSIFEGFNKKLDLYKILAGKAFKITNNEYVLEKVTANYPVGNSNLVVAASNGFIDDEKQQIILSKEVEAVFDDYKLLTSILNVDLKAEKATSNSKSIIKYKNSEIVGNTLNAESNFIRLNGNVSAKINLSDFKGI